MAYPTNYRYTREHEWIDVSGKAATVGITDHAQDSLGDIVFVELPKVGDKVEKGKVFGSVEIGEGGVGSVFAGDRDGDGDQ